MCQLDNQTEQMFVKTIGEFIEEGRAFTGYDLTLRTREREKVRLRHSDVKAGIHELQTLKDLVDFDVWNKELCDLGNGLQAFLYFKDGYDKAQYQPFSSQNSTPSSFIAPSPGIALIPNTTGDEDDDDQDDSGGETEDGYKLDYRNRLLVPTKFLRDANLKPGSEAYIYKDGNALYVGPSQPLTTNFQTRTVERNGDLRISLKLLNEIGGFVGHYFNIENAVQNPATAVKITESE
jgi:hypothetical protein